MLPNIISQILLVAWDVIEWWFGFEKNKTRNFALYSVSVSTLKNRGSSICTTSLELCQKEVTSP